MIARVYRLTVIYPEGSHDEYGQPIYGWEPSNWMPDLHDPEEDPRPFSWPKVHLYLSQSGAVKRASLLRSFGATVRVESSKPVEWDGARD